MSKPLIFICSAHADQAWKDRLVASLKPFAMRGHFDLWQAGDLHPGDQWAEEIDHAIDRASLTILLVSPDFLASDYIHETEMPRLKKRWDRGRLRVLPLLIRPSSWRRIDWLKDLQLHPGDGVALSTLNDPAVDTQLTLLADEVLDFFDSHSPVTEQAAEPDVEAASADAVLTLCNQAAFSLYRQHVLGQDPGDISSFSRSRETLAGDYWDQADYAAQCNYIKLRREKNPEFIQQKVCQLLADGFLNGTGCRTWIIGAAGTGKTTAIYRIYFQILVELDDAARAGHPAPYPIPMLIQPQKLNERIIGRLRATGKGREFLIELLSSWVERRRFTSSGGQLRRLCRQLLDELSGGRITLLIDSYDELSRMDIQLDLFRHLFSVARIYVCATRPEMYTESPEYQALYIRSAWDVSTIRTYLERVFAETPAVAEALASQISRRDKVDWLRNPRYLSMLSSMLLRLSQSGAAPDALMAVLEQGQYQLLSYLYNSTLQRLYRIWRKRQGLSPLDEQAFEREVKRRLQHGAEATLASGAFMHGHLEVVEIWDVLANNASESVACRGELATTWHFHLINYNWIDFFLVDTVLQDLLVQVRGALSLSHMWTSTLLTYVTEAAHTDRSRGGLERLGMAIRVWLDHVRSTDHRSAIDEHDLEGLLHRYQAINLVHLLVRVEMLAGSVAGGARFAEDRSHELRFRREDFSRLHLDSVDLQRLAFVDCDFSGARLTKANLERVRCRECDFTDADLRDANADHAEFEDCEFTLEPQTAEGDEASISLVAGMSIQGAMLSDYGEDLTPEFKRSGAIAQRSRYKSPFGRLFFARQREMLGAGLDRAERRYLGQVRSALGKSRERPRYLIDLMAGGSNQRLVRLFSRFSGLRVLAIDRDGSGMNEIVDEVGERFAMIEQEIEGEIDLGAHLAAHFEASSADLVIGKKAIHELPRAAQIELICSARNVLSEGGRLILFTDSPQAIDDSGRQWLAVLQQTLRGYRDRDLRPLTEQLRSLRFGDSPADIAVFSNLWVHLKDWANGNQRELEQRYFSSAQEIAAWARDAGLKPVTTPYSDHYQLVARRFNEFGFNQVHHRLEESGGVIADKDVGLLSDALEGGDRFRLFCDVVEHHLWDAAYERPTALGAAVNARRVPIDFHKLNPALRTEKLSLSYDSGIGFDFSIHVHAFDRRESN